MVNYLTLQFGFMASLFLVGWISALCVVLHFDFHFAIGKVNCCRSNTLHLAEGDVALIRLFSCSPPPSLMLLKGSLERNVVIDHRC